jgi:hypothetical protein
MELCVETVAPPDPVRGFDMMLQAFADSGGDADLLQMIDSTVIRAHRCAAGANGGPK